MPIEFGVVDHIDQQDLPIHATYDSRLELLELYDRAGFSTFHITEHHFTPLGLAPSPLMFLAAASRVTQRIRFAPLVLIATLYNPLRLAGEICMLDHLTHGRLEIGAGRGISPFELAFFGVNHLESPALFRETMDVVMAALTKDVVTHHGTYHKVTDVPILMRPFQRPHPPLWYATGSRDGAAWAARQNMNVCFLHPPAIARGLVEAYKAAWHEAHGGSGLKMPKVGITRHMHLADTDQEAVERGMKAFEEWYEKYVYLWRKYDPTHPGGFDKEALLETGRVIMGSPRTVREQMQEHLEVTGANYFVTRFAYGNLRHEESVRSFELFRREVMPHFTAAPAPVPA